MIELVRAYESAGLMRKAAWFKRELIGVMVERAVRFGGSISSDQRKEIIKLIEQVCRSFRISMDHQLGDGPLLIDYRVGVVKPAPPGWRELQMGVLTDAIIACNLLNEHANELRFRLKLNELLGCGREDGFEIQEHYRRTDWLLKSLPQPSLEYWGPRQIVLTIELLPLSSRHAVIPHLRPTPPPGNIQNSQPSLMPSTFYYCPNQMSSGSKKDKGPPVMRMVKDQPITVWVTLQNPLPLDLDISMICLSTAGILFDAAKTQTVIKAQTIKVVPLTGVPLSTGTLRIKGCHVQLIGAQGPREFVLPTGKLKRRKTDEEEEFISCQVVDSMPFLRILSNCEQFMMGPRGVMVYDGETTTIEISMTNTSPVRADWVEVSVLDNLSEGIRKRLEEKSYQLDEFERHQMEYELVNQSVLTVIERSATIEPHGIGWVRMKCLGRVGCRSLGIRIDYGVASHFFKRQLECNLSISVQKSLHLAAFKTLPGGLIVIQVTNSGHAGQVFQVEAKGGRADSKPFIQDSQKQVLQPGFLIEIEPIEVTQTDLERVIPSLFKRQFIINQPAPGRDQGYRKEGRGRGSHEGEEDDGRKTPGGDLERVRGEERMKETLGRVDKSYYLIQEHVLKTVRLEWRAVGSNRTGEISLRRDVLDTFHRNHRYHQKVEFIRNLGAPQVQLHLAFANLLPADHLPTPAIHGQKSLVSLKTDQFYPVQIRIKNLSGIKGKVKIDIKVMRMDGSTLRPTPPRAREEETDQGVKGGRMMPDGGRRFSTKEEEERWTWKQAEEVASRRRRHQQDAARKDDDRPHYLIQGVIQQPGHVINDAPNGKNIVAEGTSSVLLLDPPSETAQDSFSPTEALKEVTVVFFSPGVFRIQALAFSCDHPVEYHHRHPLGLSDDIQFNVS